MELKLHLIRFYEESLLINFLEQMQGGWSQIPHGQNNQGYMPKVKT